MSPIENAYDRFSIERFALPSEAQLEALEQRLRVTLPADYRRFVLEFNGGYFNEPEITTASEGCPCDGLTCLHGIGATDEDAELGLPRRLALFDDNDPPQVVPIGHTGMGGLIILVTRPEDRGAILLKQAFGEFFYLAEGIAQFFELLREPNWS